jgi:hypothetical protein
LSLLLLPLVAAVALVAPPPGPDYEVECYVSDPLILDQYEGAIAQQRDSEDVESWEQELTTASLAPQKPGASPSQVQRRFSPHCLLYYSHLTV